MYILLLFIYPFQLHMSLPIIAGSPSYCTTKALPIRSIMQPSPTLNWFSIKAPFPILASTGLQ